MHLPLLVTFLLVETLLTFIHLLFKTLWVVAAYNSLAILWLSPTPWWLMEKPSHHFLSACSCPSEHYSFPPLLPDLASCFSPRGPDRWLPPIQEEAQSLRAPLLRWSSMPTGLNSCSSENHSWPPEVQCLTSLIQKGRKLSECFPTLFFLQANWRLSRPEAAF